MWPKARRIELPRRDAFAPIELSHHEAGDGPAVVLCHGFPELGYSWRHQLAPLAEAGFRVLAPDQRGYGESSRPDATQAYGLTELTGDLVGLLDACGIERAVFVGHDWGGFVAWAMPLLHPERCAGVVGICTPYTAMPRTDVLRTLVGGEDERLYILWFQPPGVAEKVLDANVRLVFDRMLRAPLPPEQAALRMLGADGRPDMNPFRRLEELEPETPLCVTPAELDHYVEVFERTGFGGGVSWYRNIDRNAEEHPGIGSEKLALPCLMLSAAWDPVLRPEMAAGMPALCTDLEMDVIEGAGHWVQQEKPEALNARLIDWLKRRFG